MLNIFSLLLTCIAMIGAASVHGAAVPMPEPTVWSRLRSPSITTIVTRASFNPAPPGGAPIENSSTFEGHIIRENSLITLPWPWIDGISLSSIIALTNRYIGTTSIAQYKVRQIGIMLALASSLMAAYRGLQIRDAWETLKTVTTANKYAFIAKHGNHIGAENARHHFNTIAAQFSKNDSLRIFHSEDYDKTITDYRKALQTLIDNENLAQWSPSYHLYKLARRITSAR